MGQNLQSTSAAASTTPLQDLPSPPPLLLLLDVPFPDLKNLFLCCLARVHQEDRNSFTRKSTSPLKNVLAKALLTFTRKSTHSQERACKCTFDFYSQVNLTSQERACMFTFDFPSQVTCVAVFIPSGKACHCGTNFFCGAVILLL